MCEGCPRSALSVAVGSRTGQSRSLSPGGPVRPSQASPEAAGDGKRQLLLPPLSGRLAVLSASDLNGTIDTTVALEDWCGGARVMRQRCTGPTGRLYLSHAHTSRSRTYGAGTARQDRSRRVHTVSQLFSKRLRIEPLRAEHASVVFEPRLYRFIPNDPPERAALPRPWALAGARSPWSGALAQLGVLRGAHARVHLSTTLPEGERGSFMWCFPRWRRAGRGVAARMLEHLFEAYPARRGDRYAKHRLHPACGVPRPRARGRQGRCRFLQGGSERRVHLCGDAQRVGGSVTGSARRRSCSPPRRGLQLPRA